jgi:hypothetical protein
MRILAIILFLAAVLCGYESLRPSQLTAAEEILITRNNITSSGQLTHFVGDNDLHERASKARRDRISARKLSAVVSLIFVFYGFALLKKPRSRPVSSESASTAT